MQKEWLDKQYNKIHFIGIGGVSMSALALMLKDKGFSVQGSDGNKSNATDNLEQNGVKVFIGHNSDNITSDVDLVVHTAAIKEDNVEFVISKDKKIKIIDRAELLGMISKNYEIPIAVAGTHGKSTTTSIVSKIFLENDLNPTISVGGFLKEINGNLKIGDEKYFIFEACEYYDSFLKFYPKIACILNVELDHVDYFNSFDDYIKSFNMFCKNLPQDGYLVVNNKIDRLDEILKDVKCEVFTIGFENARLCAKNISYDSKGLPTFDIYLDDKHIKTLKISQVGEHNIFNTLTAIAISICAKIDIEKAFESASEFTGIDRRFQIKGEYNGCTIIDDYAHHPTEISFALNAQREATQGKTFVIFQPHTYTRTKQFYKEFAQSLKIADCVILVDIYAAREKNVYDISSKDIFDILENENVDVKYFATHKEALDFSKENITANDSLITMGAGDVYKIGEMILEK